MDLGNHLSAARKQSGFSQENVAEHLGVSRQTISKWETGETLPDIYQAKKLANLYRLSLDKLISYDIDAQALEQTVVQTSPEAARKVDWDAVWAKKYPVLASYQSRVDSHTYAADLQAMLSRLQNDYGFSRQDAFLVLKDILAKQLGQ